MLGLGAELKRRAREWVHEKGKVELRGTLSAGRTAVADLAESPVEQSDRADVLKIEDGGAVGSARIVMRYHLEILPRGEAARPGRVVSSTTTLGTLATVMKFE